MLNHGLKQHLLQFKIADTRQMFVIIFKIGNSRIGDANCYRYTCGTRLIKNFEGYNVAVGEPIVTENILKDIEIVDINMVSANEQIEAGTYEAFKEGY